MTQGYDSRDYWSFVEKIQDATDYVQEALVENARLEKRLAELEEDNRTLRAQRATLRRLIPRVREEDELLRYQIEELRQPRAELSAVPRAAVPRAA